MMKKKTPVVFVYLALFAFTLGLSFTLASQAQAVLGCCVLEYCNEQTFEIGYQGHEIKLGGATVCVYTGTSDCDFIHTCAEPFGR